MILFSQHDKAAYASKLKIHTHTHTHTHTEEKKGGKIFSVFMTENISIHIILAISQCFFYLFIF